MNKRIQLSLFSSLLALVMATFLASCGNAPVSTTSTTPGMSNTSATTGNTSIQTSANSGSTSSSASSSLLKVTSVNMTLNPSTINNMACGTTMTENYVAVFHFPTNNTGGQVKFEYTLNNGRSSQPASLTVSPGQTSATYTFKWSGQLSSDNLYPGRGGILVTVPNAYTSSLIAPSGTCSLTSTVPFKVNSVGLVAGPEITAADRCGASFTENYTATFHIAAGGPGGTIVFQYTTNNGRSSSSNVSLPVAAGQTSVTYTFMWSGVLPGDHTAPGIGGVMVSTPNNVQSPFATPVGRCNTM